jgi:EGF-like domain
MSVVTTVTGTTLEVECGGHGVCDDTTGICRCYPGWQSRYGVTRLTVSINSDSLTHIALTTAVAGVVSVGSSWLSTQLYNIGLLAAQHLMQHFMTTRTVIYVSISFVHVVKLLLKSASCCIQHM